MHKKTLLCVASVLLSAIIVHGAPQGNGFDTFSEVFKLCSDLESEGYEGYSCVPQNSCQDGYLVSNVVDGDLRDRQGQNKDLYVEELDVSNFECTDKEDKVVRQDYDEYGDYDGYVDDSDDPKLICCRDPKFFGKGRVVLGNRIVADPKEYCEGWEEDGFECVSKRDCGEDGHFSSEGSQVITGPRTADVNFLNKMEEAINSKCYDQSQTCCRKETYFNAPFGGLEAPKNPIVPKRDNEPRVCGIRNTEITEIRIAGATRSRKTPSFGEWPNMCIILNRLEFDGKEEEYYKCGASLIAPNIVLTAAHCVASLKAENTIVRCGEHNAAKINEPLPHQDRPAKHISIHPSFNMKNLYYDFALVHTKTDYDLNEEYIQPICLPDQFGQVPTFDDEPCFTMGYGKDGYGAKHNFSPVLKATEMYNVDFDQCEVNHRDEDRPNFNLHHSFNCFQGDGSGTCSGDGGSPLVCPISNSDRYMQVGVTSWGEDDCSGNKPDVFGDVSKALGFIDWASKCVEGVDTDFYGLVGYERWAKRQYCKNKIEIQDIQDQLKLQNNPNEKDLRKNWRRLALNNNKFEEAIQNCAKGPKDFDCTRPDYIRSKDDFGNLINPNREKSEAEVGIEHDAWVRSDVDNY